VSTAGRPLVVVGLPRSGTTWTTRVLGAGPDFHNLGEPDNEDFYPSAIHAKRRLGRYPVLDPGDSAPPYRALWDWILHGAPESARTTRARLILGPGSRDRIFDGRLDAVGRLAGLLARNPDPHSSDILFGRRVIAKSIHAQLALDWLASEFDIDVLVLVRHPASVLASWLEVNLKDARNETLETRADVRARFLTPWGVPDPGPDPIERMSWKIGLLSSALEDSIARHPDWVVRSHEAMCADPDVEFRRLFAELRIDWNPHAEEYLRDHDTPGVGFDVRRVAAEMPDSWQRRLDDDQLATLRKVFQWFPVTRWSDVDFERPSGA